MDACAALACVRRCNLACVEDFEAAVSCCNCRWLLTSAGVTQVLVEQLISTVGARAVPGAVADVVV